MTPANNDPVVKMIIYTEKACNDELRECPAIRKAMATAAVNNCSISLISWNCSSEPILSNLLVSPLNDPNCSVISQIKLYRHEAICLEITHSETATSSSVATSETANSSEQSNN